MAALSITPGNVLPVANTYNAVRGFAGATLVAGQICYKDTTDSNKFKLADADSPTAMIRAGVYMALNGASAGQPVSMLQLGDVELGAVAMTVGLSYYLNDVAGEIVPRADLEIGDYVVHLGIALTATRLKFQPLNSGVAIAA